MVWLIRLEGLLEILDGLHIRSYGSTAKYGQNCLHSQHISLFHFRVCLLKTTVKPNRAILEPDPEIHIGLKETWDTQDS